MPVAISARQKEDPQVRPETRRPFRQFVAVHPGHIEVGNEDRDLPDVRKHLRRLPPLPAVTVDPRSSSIGSSHQAPKAHRRRPAQRATCQPPAPAFRPTPLQCRRSGPLPSGGRPAICINAAPRPTRPPARTGSGRVPFQPSRARHLFGRLDAAQGFGATRMEQPVLERLQVSVHAGLAQETAHCGDGASMPVQACCSAGPSSVPDYSGTARHSMRLLSGLVLSRACTCATGRETSCGRQGPRGSTGW